MSDETLIRVETTLVSATAASYPDVVDNAQTELVRRIQYWAKIHGYWVAGHRAEVRRDPTTLTVQLTVEGFLRPRTDGEWPAIHQAVREDLADREALRPSTPTIPPF